MRPAKKLELLALLASLSVVACDCDDCDDDDDHPSVPVFLEIEPNNDPPDADHFGVIRPGDHFIIEGTIRDDALDPFDGFGFTAGDLIHVDFQLFIEDPHSDLDICLYDPQLDQTIACFATMNDPEQGGVDVVSAGFDFHLVVESFVGISRYQLEIAVQPLLAATAPAREAGETQSTLSAVGASQFEGREPAAERGYTQRRAERLEIEQTIEVDRTSGLVLETIRVSRRREGAAASMRGSSSVKRLGARSGS